MSRPVHPPVPLRQYALLADGECGALIGPRGNIAFLCAPQWHDDALFAGLLGGAGEYSSAPPDPRYVWGGHYEQDTLIWRSRWVSTTGVTECREALAFPGARGRVVLLRRIEATLGDAHVLVELDCRAEFGARPMIVRRSADGVWSGHSGDLHFRFSGAPAHARLADGHIKFPVDLPAGGHHDLVLEVSRARVDDELPDPGRTWRETERAWSRTRPDLAASVAPGESGHSHAVLRGLTSSSGAMVAAATTALPERANQGRNYDYRYAWIRDQCYAGQAAAVVGSHELLDAAVAFVSARVLEDGERLRPAYTVNGDPVPDERPLRLPGYPGAPVRVGNHANQQFQLDALGECLLLLAAADRAGRLDATGNRAAECLVTAIDSRQGDRDAGIWELDDRHWAHSRLMCAAGLRAVGASRGGRTGAAWIQLAERLVAAVDDDCLHPEGRWQRSPHDPAVDASLLLPGIRGAVSHDDPRNVATIRAVVDMLTDDGYVYRFRQDPDVPLHEAEGAFVLSGFHLALASLGQGDTVSAVRWFERNRGSLGPPGLFTEEYDVVQRQLRGNLPQAFVHALLLETAQRLGEAGVTSRGFDARDR
ncbi:MAG: glycoside hydrolase family 15 protein [Nocardioides sp.]